jgi:hypothetical protein
MHVTLGVRGQEGLLGQGGRFFEAVLCYLCKELNARDAGRAGPVALGRSPARRARDAGPP